MNVGGPLEGIKVLDFGWWHAAPCATKFLGDCGATVIKVESHINPDGYRTTTPYAACKSGINRSGGFSSVNSSKYSIALNLKNPRGINIAKELVRWADVVTESFTPRTMKNWGLDYDNLKEIKPDIIMCSITLQGQDGPYASQPSLGTMAQAIVGIDHLCGWPDRAPAGPWYSYTDTVIPPIAVVAIMAALDLRRREGKGQHIDVNQLEAGLHFIAPVILDYTANGREQVRQGNRSRYAAPHGVYRCKGEDKWCAISVSTEGEWESFCKVVGLTWTRDARFATMQCRKENEEELDKLVQEWAVNYTPEEVMEQMQAVGVAAGAVLSGKDFVGNPIFRCNGFLQTLDHPEMGNSSYMAPPFRFSEALIKMRPAPCLGQDTEYVITEILGMSDQVFLKLMEEGVLT